MFKALLKKQLLEVNLWLLQDKKKSKRRSTLSIVLLALLYIVLFGVAGGMFSLVSYFLCEPLCILELDWLYFATLSLLAVFLGVFGSVFTTFTTLYEAKDNELLLSMPIKPSYILAVRVLGVYFWSFIYSAIVFIPAIVVYLIFAKFSVSALVCGIFLLFMISVFVLALSCVLGWVVAKISARLKNKSFVTVLASLLFIVVYYIFYFKATEILQEFLAYATVLGAKIKDNVLPLYWIGKAGTGDYVSLVLISIIIIAIIFLIIYVMNRSFIKMATTNRVSNKKKYIKSRTNTKSVDMALLGKEFRRFTSSANYMLNCAMGSIIMPVVGIVAIIKADFIREFIGMLPLSDGFVLMILCAGMCMISTMNSITAPSVSLEGKHIWIVQSLPILPWKILKAKLNLHLILTEIPIIICAVCLCFAVELDLIASAICILLPVLFVFLNAVLGLFVNLKTPNLTWTNEVVPIKQSFATFVSIFGGWAFIIGLGVLYYFIRAYISPLVYLMLCGVIIMLLSIILVNWIKNKGSKVFSAL